MKAVKIVLLLGTAILVTFCSSKLYIPNTENITAAKKSWPEADSIFVFQGYYLYVNKCGKCHYLYKPCNYTEKQLVHVLPVMKEKAKLSQEEYHKIEVYLKSKSKLLTDKIN